MQSRLFIVFLFLSSFGGLGVFSQQWIQGRIVADSASVEGVHVMNLVSEKAVVSDANGRFTITVQEDDLLVFSAVHLEYARKSIGTEELKKGEVVVHMSPKTIALEEVTLKEYPNINAQALGVINYTPKSYTPAERRLETATSWKPQTGEGLLCLDPLINWMSGRTKHLKKELGIEERERFKDLLEFQIKDDFYVSNLKIPKDFINAFKFYVVEEALVQTTLELKDIEKLKFELGKIAVDFLHYYENY